MGSPSLARIPKINLSKYVNIGGDQWRFCQVVVSANGRIRPDWVIVAGKPEFHREGAYYIDWYEKGTRRRRSVGKNAIEAHTEQQRQIQLLRNEALGIEVVHEKEEPSATTIADSCESFLEEASARGGKPTSSTVSRFDISRSAAMISKLERLAAAIS